MIKQTSRDAYEAVKPHINETHVDVIEALMFNDQGLTVSEIASLTDRFLKTITNRVCELKSYGVIEDTKRVRPNKRQRNETVLRLVPGRGEEYVAIVTG